MSGCLSRPEQLNFVTESPALASLEYLNVSKCAIDETSLQKILESPNLRNLELLGFASMKNATKKFLIPAKTKYGMDHKLQAIDLRNNPGLNMNQLNTISMNKVMVFAWTDKKVSYAALMRGINNAN